MLKIVRYAPEAWNMLQGVFCVYKPADMTMNHLRKVLIGNLSRDLNLLKTRLATPMVAIEGSVTENLVVKVTENYADHPLVLGPRYQPKDIKLAWAHQLDKNISGVCILGVNSGTKGTHKVRESQLIRSYMVSGQFGRTTDTLFNDGKVIGKSTYKHVTRGRLMRTLMTIQAGHQRSALHFLGLDPQSQEAYEALSADGLVRPGEKSPPLIYALKIVDFNLPDFTLEVSCINENAVYLQHLVHDLALRLKTTAVCTQMRCIRYGPWTLQHSLLHKHWCLEHILDNITRSKPLFKDIMPKSASLVMLKDEQSKEL